MRAVFILLFPLITFVLHAQEWPSVKEKAKGYVAVLAGPEMHGRGYVQGGDSLAAEWIAQQFEQLGLGPLEGRRFEDFSFPVNTFPDSVKVRIDGKTLVPGIDFITDPASGAAEGNFDLVRITAADLINAESKARTLGALVGRAAYLDLATTSNRDTLRMYKDWEAEVGRLAPVIRRGGSKLTWSVANEQSRNAVVEVLAGVVPDTARSVELKVRNKFIPKHAARNVFGVVKAKRKSAKWLVITAHYDHLGHMGPDALFPGANDNASGTSMLLSLAEHIRQHPLKVNVLFIAFAGEEAGLQGSTWCVADRPIDLARIRLLVNLDLNGTGEDGITVVNAVEQAKVYDKLIAINERKHRLAQVKARGPACNSDHCPFAMKGVPAIFIYTMGGVSFYHDVLDKPETLSFAAFDALYYTLIDLMSTVK